VRVKNEEYPHRHAVRLCFPEYKLTIWAGKLELSTEKCEIIVDRSPLIIIVRRNSAIFGSLGNLSHWNYWYTIWYYGSV
jgi:hypothetical protein